jgi:hypothetical protein
MYQIIDGAPVEVKRWGDEILPVTDDRVNQIIGQGILFLYDQDSGNFTYEGFGFQQDS